MDGYVLAWVGISAFAEQHGCVRAYFYVHTWVTSMCVCYNCLSSHWMLPLPNERFRTAIVCTIHTGACVCVCVSFPYHAECDWHCKMVLRAAYLYNTDYCCCAKNNNAKINTWQSSESRVLFGAFAYFVDRIEWTDFMYTCVRGLVSMFYSQF